MYTLQKLNVVKKVDNENSRDRLLAQGFELKADKQSSTGKKKTVDTMEYAEMKALAKEKGVEGYNRMKKDDLVSALKALEEK